ncbi:hypothetical protein GCM10017576_18970 [Microbacterium barkeri]|uniref:Pyridoxine 5'-phosphate oxidase dimerisation C-terminal domain-containing protein n=2 Tax=Microbacterium barkeri TaxID=33917 RepID=A0A9W6LWT0_9MICO|nr:hypothetical protein GCM10017576_18970 [Microbacterium barkeri]
MGMALLCEADGMARQTRTPAGRCYRGRGVHFAGRRSARKGRHLAQRPVVGAHVFWRALGRQVEVSGEAVALSADESAADWLARPTAGAAVDPDWQAWAIRPDRVEFFQAAHDRDHVRVVYLRDTGGWRRERA